MKKNPVPRKARFAAIAALPVILALAVAAGGPGSGQAPLTFDCYSVIVGRNASVDGSVILGHNEDTGTELVNYYKVPRRTHAAGEEIVFETGGRMPQVPETAAYLWIDLPVCDVCDSYVNEYGVAIASDGCPSREDKPALVGGGLVYWVRRAVAERARTARDAVRIVGELIERYGYASSGRTYLIADKTEGWILDAVYGRHWLARRVPDDEIAVVPNSYTIRQVRLDDAGNVLHSPGLVEYAIERGWYDPKADGAFDFAKAFSAPGSLAHPANVNRAWLGTTRLSGRAWDVQAPLPFSFKPVKKAGLKDVMSLLRDHGDGTFIDKSEGGTKGSPHASDGAICGPGTQYSLIAHLRGGLAPEIATAVWIAPFRPDVQAYTAWYPSMTGIPGVYAKGDWAAALARHFDASQRGPEPGKPHAFRAFVTLTDLVEKDFARLGSSVRKEWDAFERAGFREQAELEAKVAAERDAARRIALINEQTGRRALAALAKAEEIAARIR